MAKKLDGTKYKLVPGIYENHFKWSYHLFHFTWDFIWKHLPVYAYIQLKHSNIKLYMYIKHTPVYELSCT